MKGEKEMKKKQKKDKEVDYPFITHGTPIFEKDQYPTHTHGLTEVGWPEFFIDPLAFFDASADRATDQNWTRFSTGRSWKSLTGTFTREGHWTKFSRTACEKFPALSRA